MTTLSSVRFRLFLTGWVLCTVPFATNIVREHYPAFTIAEDLTFKVDRYLGFHPDIFEHHDGHSYIGNNVVVSVFAAVPLFVFDPALDWLEERSGARLAAGDPLGREYRTDKPNRVAFFERVTEQGLELRFGAAAFITTAFLMAPLTALIILLMFDVLRRRGVPERRAVWLALLFGFGTPIFFRTLHLNHNMFLMYAVFLAFALLWLRRGDTGATSAAVRFWAGMLCGFTLAADYAGAVLILAVYMYLVLSRLSTASFADSVKESLAFVAGTVPPVLFLLYSQWAMYGNPFLPGQYWMPEVNYTDRGWRGFSLPTPDLLFLNLFDLRYGMFTFGPILLLAFVPWRGHRDRILPRAERWFVWGLFASFLLFCAANQYSRMQFNSGFRYLVPLVPFVFLLAADHLARLPRGWLWAVTGVTVLHSWVLATFRESVTDSWALFLQEGVTLPWLRVLQMTSAPDAGIIFSPILPIVITFGTLAGVWALWRWPRRSTVRQSAPVGEAGVV